MGIGGTCLVRFYAIGLYPWGAENGYFTFTSSELSSDWHSYAAVWDGSKVSLYLDGSQKLAPTSFTDGLTLNTKAAGFKIGKAFYNGSSYFKGNLDEVAVCNRALTDAEIAAYSKSGIAALMTQPLASNLALTLTEGATLSTPHTAQTIAGLDGTGTVTVKSLTLTKHLSGATTVNGDLMLGDGIVIHAGATPTTVSGKVTFAGGGTVLLPSDLPKSGSWTLITASSFVGTERLADCTFENLPRNTVAELKVVDGDKLVLTWAKKGLFLVVR